MNRARFLWAVFIAGAVVGLFLIWPVFGVLVGGVFLLYVFIAVLVGVGLLGEASVRSPRWRIGATLLLIAGGVAYCAYDEPDHIPFDREFWRNGERWSPSNAVAPRILMAEGLILDRSLLGKRRAEIEEMLGPPSNAGYFRDYDLVYWLGPEGLDSRWLLLRLNAAGTVGEAKLASD